MQDHALDLRERLEAAFAVQVRRHVRWLETIGRIGCRGNLRECQDGRRQMFIKRMDAKHRVIPVHLVKGDPTPSLGGRPKLANPCLILQIVVVIAHGGRDHLRCIVR